MVGSVAPIEQSLPKSAQVFAIARTGFPLAFSARLLAHTVAHAADDRLAIGSAPRIEQPDFEQPAPQVARQCFEPFGQFGFRGFPHDTGRDDLLQPVPEFDRLPLVREPGDSLGIAIVVFEFNVPLGGKLRFPVPPLVPLPENSHVQSAFQSTCEISVISWVSICDPAEQRRDRSIQTGRQGLPSTSPDSRT